MKKHEYFCVNSYYERIFWCVNDVNNSKNKNLVVYGTLVIQNKDNQARIFDWRFGQETIQWSLYFEKSDSKNSHILVKFY